MTRISTVEEIRLGLRQKAPTKQSKRTGNVYMSQAQWDAKKIPGGVLFIIPENMPSLNVWKGWHWGKQGRFKDRLSDNLWKLSLVVDRPTYQRARVEVVHYHRVKRRRDADNMAPKFLLDALRYAGVLVDDSADVLELPEPRFEIDPKAWRTEVFVYERDYVPGYW